MRGIFKIAILAFISGIIYISLPGTGVSAASVLPDGSLIRVAGNPRIYYVEGGARRWIESAEAFRVQGFRWSEIKSVSPDELAAYPEKESLTVQSRIILPSEVAVLPDLAPFAAADLRLAKLNGRTVLRFTSTFWNKGKGPFELLAYPSSGAPADSEEETFQRLVGVNRVARNTLVGNFLWHSLHNHYHYGDFADYALELVKPLPGEPPVAPSIATKKSTFCMRDNTPVDLTLDRAAKRAVYVVCGKYRQGVSVGWADVYAHTLQDQYIDVHDLPTGVYRLTFKVDPREHFLEVQKDNNLSVAFIELNPEKNLLRVIASASPFATAANRYQDGMLVRAEADSKVYVVSGGKKRWLRTPEVFASYGYSWGAVYELPARAVEAIPPVTLIRVKDTGTIYAVNKAGYRRRVLSPEIFRSYGWTDKDIAAITQAEFETYPQTELITRSGTNLVYSIVTKRFVGTFDQLPGLGLDSASVHPVNDTDFDSYAVQVVAKDLFVPWDIVFLPDGDMLVTERSGTLRRLGKNAAVISLPGVLHIGEGGLMGIALHPEFEKNKFVYLYFTTADNGKANRVTRFRFEDNRLVEDRVIIDNIPAALYHDGGQIAFGPDNMLYITIGDAEVPDSAQNLSSLSGKTLRFTPEGTIPADNPFGTAVWSYGHRNAQGITWDGQGRMWQTEHGRSGALSGFDELNLIEKGKNYGWPTIQGPETRAGMVTPVRNSGASETWAPSGIAYVNGKLFFAGLRGSTLYSAQVGENAITDLQKHLSGLYGRLRAVVLGPDGLLYVTTSNRDGRGTVRAGDDKILRIAPDFLR